MAVKGKVETPWTSAPVGDDEITIAEAAARLGLKRQSVLHAIWVGRLPAVRRANPVLPQGVYYLRTADVDAYVVRPQAPRSRAKKSRVRHRRNQSTEWAS